MEQPPTDHCVTGPPRGRRAAHAVRPPVAIAPQMIVAAIGAAAVAGALGLGAVACLAGPDPSTSTPTSARSITVTAPPGP